ncbi:hypothetical protein [Pararhizobium haloflavum]|uniref:hypothetical protein n=1 Tax=Pararhizobium haloflavum TaxID=2037914 RepID=UPI000C196A8D|nr:hypothetical protein [Pararhizobium haloflavum]
MRQFISLGSAVAGGLVLASLPALAADHWPQDRTQAANTVTLDIAGRGNVLTIEQANAGAAGAAGNRLDLLVSGNGNGGAGEFAGAAAQMEMRPGVLQQNGAANSLELAVLGNDNLFAVRQSGAANALMAQISGHANQAVVSQAGQNNIAAFSQVGRGNIVSISQISW